MAIAKRSVTRLPVPQADAPPVLNHKIAAPQAHRHAVQRERLLTRIFAVHQVPVSLLLGPAGHGKTSLMLQAQSACSELGMLTGWISLDETDNDVRRFLGHLQEMVAGLRGSSTADAPGIPAMGSSDIVSRTRWLVDQLISLGQPVALFVDDVHSVSGRATLGFLRELLASTPVGVRWFLASRVLPNIGVSRLVVNEQAIMIKAEELCFSLSEMRRFFDRAQDIEVSDAELEAIHTVTEGWPAAVQLYRLALGSPAVRASLTQGRVHHLSELADYLAENVLMQLDAPLQDFLLKTSVLARMSGPLCNAVLGREDAHDVLSRLEGGGLFVRRVESDDRWFTYHALFSRFLEDHLRAAHPNAIGPIHRRAAEWHREHRNFEEALHHYCAAGLYHEAAEIFDQWTERLVPDGHMVTVDRWSDSLPIQELEQRPGLVVKIVWALTFLSRHRKLAPLLKLLRAIPPSASASGDPRVALSMVAILEDDLESCINHIEGIETQDVSDASRFRTFELSAVSNARGYHALAAGEFDAALRFLATGRALSDRADATFTWAYSIGKTGLALLSLGQLPESLSQLRAALSDPRMYLDESVSTACLACALIGALYEADELDEALNQFGQFREIIINAGIHDYLGIAYAAVARIHDIKGEPAEALAILDEAEQLAYSGQWPRAVQLIGWERVRRELMAGRVDRAEIIAGRMDAADKTRDPSWVRFSEELDGDVIGSIRLALHARRCNEALRMIQPHLRQAIMHRRVYRQIKLNALAALAYKQQGKDNLAHRTIETALTLAAPGGYVRALVDEGDMMSQLVLDHFRLQSSAPTPFSSAETVNFLARLIGSTNLDVAGRSGAGFDREPVSDPSRLEPFTDRERQIVRLLVNYMSNQQIAASIFVTRDTVKYHLKNIYAKLGVRTRLEAIRRIREMGESGADDERSGGFAELRSDH